MITGVDSMNTGLGTMIQQLVGKSFKTLDTDSSGSVDKKEMETYAQSLSERTGLPLDGEKFAEKFFAALDADADGAVSTEEFSGGVMKRLQELMPNLPVDAQAQTQESAGEAAAASGTAAATAGQEETAAQSFFDAMDTNKDGTVSLSEMNAWIAQNNQTLDTNGDGKVDAEEMAAAQNKSAHEEAQQFGQNALDYMDPVQTMMAQNAAGGQNQQAATIFKSLLQMGWAIYQNSMAANTQNPAAAVAPAAQTDVVA